MCFNTTIQSFALTVHNYSFTGECSPVFSSWWVLKWWPLCQSRDMLLSFRMDWKKMWKT